MAERLTERHGKYINVQPKEEIMCSNYCTSCGKADCDHIRMALERLAHYEDLEEQGKLIKLPCKIGDTVYGSFRCYDGNKINECKVIGIRARKLKANSECYYLVDVEFNIIDPFYNDGRLMFFKRQAVIGNNYGNWERVFFTKEEAEAALKGAEQ